MLKEAPGLYNVTGLLEFKKGEELFSAVFVSLSLLPLWNTTSTVKGLVAVYGWSYVIVKLFSCYFSSEINLLKSI